MKKEKVLCRVRHQPLSEASRYYDDVGLEYRADLEVKRIKLTPVQEKIDKKQEFVELAKKLALRSRANADITEDSRGITARFIYECAFLGGSIKELFAEVVCKSDDVIMLQLQDGIGMTFLYHTHDQMLCISKQHD